MHQYSILYSTIQKKDIPIIASMYIELLKYIKQETDDPYLDLEEQDTITIEKDLQQSLNNNQLFFYKATTTKNEIIGFISGEIIDCFLPLSKIKRIGYISAAYVKDMYRKRGIMNYLEKTLREQFATEGIRYIEVNVLSKNIVGKKTWESMGYTTFRESMRKSIR